MISRGAPPLFAAILMAVCGLRCGSPAVHGPDGAAGPAAGGSTGQGRPDARGGTPVLLPSSDAAPAVQEAGVHFGDGMGCNTLMAKFDAVTPTVAILVDRSSSMDKQYGNGTRWQVLKTALLDPATGLIKPNEQQVRWALATYTSYQQAAACPHLGAADGQGVASTLSLMPAVGGYERIRAAYEPSQPPRNAYKGETPTGEAVSAVAAALEPFAEPGPKYILLATDGEPDTCPGTCASGNCPTPNKPGYPRDPNCGQDRSITAVQAAHAKGIKTFVLALGNEVATEHLQALANAGTGLPVVLGEQANWLRSSCNLPADQLAGTYAMSSATKAPFFRPGDQDELAQALKTILSSVRSCKFMLQGEVEATLADKGMVTLDGMALAHGDPNGWQLNSKRELELLGAACKHIQTGPARNLDVRFPCGAYRVIE